MQNDLGLDSIVCKGECTATMSVDVIWHYLTGNPISQLYVLYG